MKILQNKPVKSKDPSRIFITYAIFISIILIVIMLIIAGISFIINLNGTEQVKVPEITDFELEDGMLQLQTKALNPFIQMVYSPDIEDRGKIMDQDPAPGTIVKAGSRVTLSISKGPVIEKLSDYSGKNIDYVRSEIRSLVSIYGQVLEIKEPLIEQHSDEPYGTILEQSPKPGTSLTAGTEISFIVSLGPEGEIISVPDLIGNNYFEAIKATTNLGLPFLFVVRNANIGEETGRVVRQNPVAGERVPRQTQLKLN